jgi:hypothetical protein
MHKKLEFKLKEEENKNINHLDLSIHRHNNNIYLGIYRKPTQTDITIHFTSNHPLELKRALYIFHIIRMITLPIAEKSKTRKEHYPYHS